MNNKYTLCFVGKNKFGHVHEIKLMTENLKNIDLYTCNFINYVDLFNNLPISVKEFIEEELSDELNSCDNNILSKVFYIKNENEKLDLLFNDDLDVVYISPLEVANLICNEKMSYKSFGRVILNMSATDKDKKTYDFFKYLYENYVKNKEIMKMIDTYDVEKNLSNLEFDEKLIASIATDKNNILVLCKKISQTDEARRILAIMYKKVFYFNKTLIEHVEIEKRKEKIYDEKRTLNQINKNIEEFKINYFDEYIMS